MATPTEDACGPCKRPQHACATSCLAAPRNPSISSSHPIAVIHQAAAIYETRPKLAVARGKQAGPRQKIKSSPRETHAGPSIGYVHRRRGGGTS